MFVLLAACVALTGFLTLNIFANCGASIVWQAFARRSLRWSAEARSQFIFALRVLPVLFALFVVLAFIVPAFLRHEPREVVDELSAAIVALTLISLTGIILGASRGLASWIVTRRTVRSLLRTATPFNLQGLETPAYIVDHEFPLIALVGIFRPKLFVAALVLDSLNKEELAAAIAHESAHFHSRDNLKRAALSLCRDVSFMVPFGARLDRAWRRSSEEAADERAARGGPPVALELASALIKVAQSVPVGTRPAMPAGAIFMCESREIVATRVQRLLLIAEALRNGGRPVAKNRRRLVWRSLLVTATVVWVAILDDQFTERTHAILERFVGALQ
jgi:Zn-dependent protease with chaperone function